MVHHFINFILRSAEILPSRIGSNWGGVTFTAVVVIVGIALRSMRMTKSEWKAHWREHLKTAFLAAFIGWCGLFLVSIVLTTYDDHQNLAGAAVRLKRESLKKSSEIVTLKQQHAVDTKNIKIVTNFVPGYPVMEGHNNWVTQIVAIPNNNIMVAEGELVCSKDFILAHSDYSVQPTAIFTRLSTNKRESHFKLSGPWTPTNLLFVKVYVQNSGPLGLGDSCQVKVSNVQ